MPADVLWEGDGVEVGRTLACCAADSSSVVSDSLPEADETRTLDGIQVSSYSRG